MGTRTLSAGFGTNAVLRNTYALLSTTLLWSAVTASIGTQLHWTGVGYIGVVLAGFATLFATMGLRNSGWGVLMVFAFTGLEGLGLGPLLQHYLHLHNGAQIVGMAAGTTGLAFMALSAFVLVTRKDFSFLSSFLFIGLTGLVLVGLFGMFFHSSALQLTLSVVSLLVFSGYILMDTSRIVNGGERNYILATVSLYLDILNIFVNLLEIFGSGDD